MATETRTAQPPSLRIHLPLQLAAVLCLVGACR